MQDTRHPVRHVVSQFCAQFWLQLLPQPEHVDDVAESSQLPEQLFPQSWQPVDLAESWQVSLQVSLQLV